MSTKSTVALIREARAVLDLHIDGALARFLGVSRRTVQRHAKSGGLPIGDGHIMLIRALHPRNPDLALALAQSLNVELNEVVAPGTPNVSAAQVAELVLAACDALNMPPRLVRPALASIFRHASTLGIGLEELAQLMAEDAKVGLTRRVSARPVVLSGPPRSSLSRGEGTV
jgi:hypothetical protein